MIPTSLDAVVRDSRDRLAALRRQFPNAEDFDRFTKQAIAETLEALGHDRQTIAFTLRAIFG